MLTLRRSLTQAAHLRRLAIAQPDRFLPSYVRRFADNGGDESQSLTKAIIKCVLLSQARAPKHLFKPCCLYYDL